MPKCREQQFELCFFPVRTDFTGDRFRELAHSILAAFMIVNFVCFSFKVDCTPLDYEIRSRSSPALSSHQTEVGIWVKSSGSIFCIESASS